VRSRADANVSRTRHEWQVDATEAMLVGVVIVGTGACYMIKQKENKEFHERGD